MDLSYKNHAPESGGLMAFIANRRAAAEAAKEETAREAAEGPMAHTAEGVRERLACTPPRPFRLETLTGLELSDISTDAMTVLADALEECQSLTYLALCCDIGESGAQEVARVLTKNETLTWLEIHSGNIGAAGAEALAGALQSNQTLEVLVVGDSGIGGDGAAALAGVLHTNAALTSLILPQNDIGAAGTIALARALETNTSLYSLNIGGNDIGVEGVEALASVLQQNCTLLAIHIHDNVLSLEGVSMLAGSLANNTSVTEVNMQGCDIGSEGAAVLADMLTKNETIYSLNLKGNQIGSDGAKALAAALESNSALTTLDFSGNQIGSDGVKALAAALENNATLTTLDLSENGAYAGSLSTLVTLLEKNGTLTSIGDFGSSELSFEERSTLDELFRDPHRVARAFLRDHSPADLPACTGKHKQKACGNDQCVGRGFCVSRCMTCPDRTGNCHGHHEKKCDSRCTDLKFCHKACTLCSDKSNAWCEGAASVAHCSTDLCRGRAVCHTSCTACPDMRGRCHGRHEPCGNAECCGSRCVPDCSACPDRHPLGRCSPESGCPCTDCTGTECSVDCGRCIHNPHPWCRGSHPSAACGSVQCREREAAAGDGQFLCALSCEFCPDTPMAACMHPHTTTTTVEYNSGDHSQTACSACGMTLHTLATTDRNDYESVFDWRWFDSWERARGNAAPRQEEYRMHVPPGGGLWWSRTF